MEIDGHYIERGSSRQLKISVGRLPSDTSIYITCHVYRSHTPGDVALLLGGVHGDEINGVEILRRTIESKILNQLIRGTVIVVPLLNVYGFINFSREVPDGKDVNRSFPGSTSGSLAGRVARVVTKKILPHVNFAIDFHTGGASRYNYPQIRYAKQDHKAEQLAYAFGAPITMQSPLISKSFRKAAFDLEIPAIVYEGGESIRLDGFAIHHGIQGLKRVLCKYNMINMSEHEINPPNTILVERNTWIRAARAGLFMWTKCSGSYVQKGELLGMITDPQNNKSHRVISKYSGFILGHSNASVVNVGDALFNLSYEKQ